MSLHDPADSTITIRDLYPHLAGRELEEAEENLDRYIELVLQIYERIQLEGEENRSSQLLTSSESDATIQDTRSNPS